MDLSAALFVDIVENFTFGHVRRSNRTVVHPNTASIFVAVASGGYYELHPYHSLVPRITGISLPRISNPWLGHKVAGYTSPPIRRASQPTARVTHYHGPDFG